MQRRSFATKKKASANSLLSISEFLSLSLNASIFKKFIIVYHTHEENDPYLALTSLGKFLDFSYYFLVSVWLMKYQRKKA